MVVIWANRLVAGTKSFDEVPDSRAEAVKAELRKRVEAGEISPDRYSDITGDDFE